MKDGYANGYGRLLERSIKRCADAVPKINLIPMPKPLRSQFISKGSVGFVPQECRADG